MIKKPAFMFQCCRRLCLLLSIFLMSGCGSTSQLERPLQMASAPEPTPSEAKSELTHSETTTTTEQIVIAKIDENNSIFFSLGSSTINLRERDKLRNVAKLLKGNKTMFVTLIGHANDNGSRSYDLSVSDSRVESVGSALKKSGVNPLQIKKNVIGSEKTSSSCRSAECRQKMRRVELIISTAKSI